jgi:hypothetical protein
MSIQKSYMPDGLAERSTRSSKATALALSSASSIVANIAITVLRPMLMNIGLDGFLPLILRYLVNALWVQLYMSLTGAHLMDPIQTIALSGVVSTTFAYFDGLVMGASSCNTNSLGL